MNETEYHRLADAALDHLSAELETADADGQIEIESQNGILTIDLPSRKQLLVSKHAPTRQLWLSSPISGGLHFAYESDWKLPDGRTLYAILATELETLAGIKVAL